MTEMQSNSNKKYILYVILLLALALRLYGITFEVPHPDDYITVQGAMYFGLTQVVPTGYGLYGLYVWPGFFMVYILIILFTLYFCFGWLIGIFPTIEAFRNLYLHDPFSFYLIGRMMSIAFGVGSVWVLYYLARRLFNHKVGLLASLFLSVSFIHSFHSQFIRVDIPSTFFFLLTIMYCLMILEQGKLKYYIYAGISTGIATAIHFTSPIVMLSLFVAHIMVERNRLLNDKNRFAEKKVLSVTAITVGGILLIGGVSALILNVPELIVGRLSSDEYFHQQISTFLQYMIKGVAFLGIVSILMGALVAYSITARRFIFNLLTSKKLLLCMAATILSFVVFDPLFFLDFKKEVFVFLTDPNFMGVNNLFVGVDSLGFWGNLWWYIKGSLNWGLGLHFEIMAMLGLILVLYQRRRENLITAVFILINFILIGAGNFKWERYVIPLIPFVALYAAFFLNTLIEYIFSRRISQSRKDVILAIIAIAMILHPTYNILRYDYLLTQKDTRVMAKEWVEENIPHGSKIGQDAYTGDLSSELFQITKEFSLSRESFDYYIENGYQYLLTSDTQYRRYLNESEKHPENAEFYSRLFSEGVLIKEFSLRDDLWPKSDERFPKYHIHISPTIKVYQINHTN